MNINLGLSAIAAGTVDAITATYSPAPTLVDKKILFLRTAGTNTVTNPTFNPNSLGAKPINKNGGNPLLVGDMPYTAILQYDSANEFWDLLNPKGSSLSQDVLDALFVASSPSITNAFTTISDLSGYYFAGGTDVAVADGGTGASTAAGARTNLGLGDSATKNTGTTAGTVAAGDDSRFTNTRYTKLLCKNVTPASGTNTTSEEVLHTMQVQASQIIAGDILELLTHTGWNSNANAKQFRIYFNTTADISGSPVLVATGVSHTTSMWIPVTRRFVVNSDTQIQSNVPGNAALDLIDVITGGSNVPTNITVPSLSAGFYVVITGTKAVGTDTDTVQYSYMRRMV